MEPNQQPEIQPPQNPSQEPNYSMSAPQPAAKKITKRTKLALWLMIGPTALLVISLIGYAILNSVVAHTTPQPAPITYSATDTPGVYKKDPPTTLFQETPPAETIGSILLFLSISIVFLTWLPGIVIGIVLLTTQKKSTSTQ